MDDVTALLFDPHKLSRECFRLALGGTEFYVSDEAENLEEVLDALYEAEIDLVVINLRGCLDDVASCVRAVRELRPETRIIVIGEVKFAARLEEMRGAGADGYVLHDYSSEGLVKSMRGVHFGEKVYPPNIEMSVGRLSENEIEKLVKILVRRYGLAEAGDAPLSAESLERGDINQYVGDWKQILSAIQTMKGEASPEYRH